MSTNKSGAGTLTERTECVGSSQYTLPAPGGEVTLAGYVDYNTPKKPSRALFTWSVG